MPPGAPSGLIDGRGMPALQIEHGSAGESYRALRCRAAQVQLLARTTARRLPRRFDEGHAADTATGAGLAQPAWLRRPPPVRTVTATEASRSFAALLDEVEAGGTVVVTRGERRVAAIGPATAGNGSDVLELLLAEVLETLPVEPYDIAVAEESSHRACR